MTSLLLPDSLTKRPFTAAQAARAGVSPRTLGRQVTRGDVVLVLRDVYRSADLPDSFETRADAAALVLPPGAALCRETAAWLFGIDCREPGRQDEPPPLACVVPGGRVPVRRPGLAGYAAPLSAGDVVHVGSVPVTTPSRTACDLLRLAPPHIALAAADALARAGLLDAADLPGAMDLWSGHANVRRGRFLAGLVDPGAESAGESWMRLRFGDAGLPRPTLQIPVGGTPGRPRFLLDSGWEEHKVAAEYDGEAYHLDAAHDLWRRRILEEEYGWTIIVVRKGDVFGSSMLLKYHVASLLGLQVTLSRRRW